MPVIISLSKGEVERKFGPMTAELMNRRAKDIMEACQDEAPVDTGFLRDNHYISRVNYRTWRIVSEAPYSMFVHDGHGPEGPRRPNRWMNRGLDRVAALHG